MTAAVDERRRARAGDRGVDQLERKLARAVAASCRAGEGVKTQALAAGDVVDRLCLTATRDGPGVRDREVCLTLSLGDVTVEIAANTLFWDLVRLALVDSDWRSILPTDPEDLGECRSLDGGLKLVSYALERPGPEIARHGHDAIDVVARVFIADRQVEAIAYGAVPVAHDLETYDRDRDPTPPGEWPAVVNVGLGFTRGPAGTFEIAGQCPRCGGGHLDRPAPKITELVARVVGEGGAEADLLRDRAVEVAPEEADVGDARTVGRSDAACGRVRGIDLEAGAEGQGGHDRAPCGESAQLGSQRP